MERVHQCATVQLDFQLPIRFDLKYKSAEQLVKVKEGEVAPPAVVYPKDHPGAGFERPVMVHRAMLGSVERMFAVLTEHYGGKWPLWLSPRQVMLIPVHSDQFEYGRMIEKKLHDKGLYVQVDATKSTFQKKVRNAQIDQWNFQCIIGNAEMTNNTVNVRTRANEQTGEMDVDTFVDFIMKQVEEYK
jgi:threonyl-tRNA synthetase